MSCLFFYLETAVTFTYTESIPGIPPGLTFDQSPGPVTSPVTLSGVPTTPGSYYFQLRFVSSSAFDAPALGNYFINIDPAQVPRRRKRRNKGFAPTNTLCFNRNYIEQFYPGSCKEGGIIYSNQRIPYVFSHVDQIGNCCFKIKK